MNNTDIIPLIVGFNAGGMDHRAYIVPMNNSLHKELRPDTHYAEDALPIEGGYGVNSEMPFVHSLMTGPEIKMTYIDGFGTDQVKRGHDLAQRQMEYGFDRQAPKIDSNSVFTRYLNALRASGAYQGNLEAISTRDGHTRMLEGSKSSALSVNGPSKLNGTFPRGFHLLKKLLAPIEEPLHDMANLMMEETSDAPDDRQNNGAIVAYWAADKGIPVIVDSPHRTAGNDIHSGIIPAISTNWRKHEGEPAGNARAFDDWVKDYFDTFGYEPTDPQYKPFVSVVFSEFGRTESENGSNGSDHGLTGSCFIITNVPGLLKHRVIGDADYLSKDNLVSDALPVKVDYNATMATVLAQVSPLKFEDTAKFFSSTRRLRPVELFVDQEEPGDMEPPEEPIVVDPDAYLLEPGLVTTVDVEKSVTSSDLVFSPVMVNNERLPFGGIVDIEALLPDGTWDSYSFEVTESNDTYTLVANNYYLEVKLSSSDDMYASVEMENIVYTDDVVDDDPDTPEEDLSDTEKLISVEALARGMLKILQD